MPDALLITVHLHGGRYHGIGDEPPSPARLFQALVAGAGISGALDSKELAALEWLEKCQAPLIASPIMVAGQRVRTYVPNNDLDAVEGDPRRIGKIRTQKTTQPRLFDADVPFLYAWFFHKNQENGTHAMVIGVLAERLYQFGRGVDMAWATAEVLDGNGISDRLSTYPGLVYRPSAGSSGTVLACPRVGSLKSLLARYAAGCKRFITRRQSRSTQLFSQPPKPLFVQLGYDCPPTRLFYEIRQSTGDAPLAAWPLVRVSKLVEALRDGAAERLRNAWPERSAEIEQVLVGRKADGANDGPTSLRVRIMPMASVGHEHADRAIRRLFVEVPTRCPIRASDINWAFSGVELVHPELGTTHTLIITPSADDSMSSNYGVPGHRYDVWRTVTPIALPESAKRRRIEPGCIPADAKSGGERAAEQERAAAAVIQALRFAEIHTRPERIRVQREPFEAAGERVEAFAPGTRFAKERLWHVEIAFAERISGPLVIGDGRFLGLGIMAPVRPSARKDLRRFSTVRFLLDGPAFPFVAESVPFAEHARRWLLARCAVLARRANAGLSDSDIWPLSPAFWGKDKEGRPQMGHRHGFFLPTDEDGDGRLDHLTVFAPMGFNDLECQAFQKLHRLTTGNGETVKVRLIGLGSENDFRAPIFDRSTMWASATPFVATRYPKLRGTKRDMAEDYATPRQFARHVLEEEIKRRADLPAVVSIEDLEVIGAHRLRPVQFKRSRRKRGDDGGRRPAGAFRIVFSEPIQGPLCLGHSCHFGLGMFVPEVQ